MLRCPFDCGQPIKPREALMTVLELDEGGHIHNRLAHYACWVEDLAGRLADKLPDPTDGDLVAEIAARVARGAR